MRTSRAILFGTLINVAVLGLVIGLIAWSSSQWGYDAVFGSIFYAALVAVLLWGLAQIILSARRREKWNAELYIGGICGGFALGAGPGLIFQQVLPEKVLGVYPFGLGFVLVFAGVFLIWAIGLTVRARNRDRQQQME
jgi:hypothetical protein